MEVEIIYWEREIKKHREKFSAEEKEDDDRIERAEKKKKSRALLKI